MVCRRRSPSVFARSKPSEKEDPLPPPAVDCSDFAHGSLTDNVVTRNNTGSPVPGRPRSEVREFCTAFSCISLPVLAKIQDQRELFRLS